MIRDTFIEIFSDIWPMLFIFSIVVISIRLAYFYETKEKIIFYKEIMYLLFVIYILCLFYVVTFQDVSWSTSNYIPFKEMFRYSFGSRLFFKNVIGNSIMFLPYGFFVSYLLKTKKPFLILLLSFVGSITIEATQLIIGRVFDIDDIFLNVIGGLSGYFLYRILHNIREKLPRILKNDAFYNIIFIVILIICVLYFTKALGV